MYFDTFVVIAIIRNRNQQLISATDGDNSKTKGNIEMFTSTSTDREIPKLCILNINCDEIP